MGGYMQSSDTASPHVRHASAVPASDEQLWEMSAGYIAKGLEAGDRVVYFEDESVEQVLGRLGDDGVHTADALDEGRLLVVPTEETREVLSGPVVWLEDILHAFVDDSLRRVHKGVRFACQASWSVRRAGGVGTVQYEGGLSRVLAARRAAGALCLYDQSRFPAELIGELRGMHQHEVTAESVYDDGLLRITSTALGNVRLAGEADYSNRGVLDRLLDTVLDEALRAASGRTSVTMDLSSLRFLDVAGSMALVSAADRFPITHRLVLQGARPRVHRVLERCGALFTPQLDLRAAAEPIRIDVPLPRPSNLAKHERVPAHRS
jgi:anti-anti-sigma regulatory factor